MSRAGFNAAVSALDAILRRVALAAGADDPQVLSFVEWAHRQTLNFRSEGDLEGQAARIYQTYLVSQGTPTKQRPGDQSLPVKNDGPCIQDMVMADIEARKRLGVERYGTTLQPHNGRDALQDLYEEQLDGLMYLKQVIYERDHPVVVADDE